MAGPRLEVTFASKAELDGAKAFAESLERQIGKAKAAGKETGELDKQLASVKQTITQTEKALGTETTAVEKTTEATKKLETNKRALKETLKGLAFELPVVARLLSFLQNPATAAAAALGVTIGVLQRWKQRLDEASDAQAKLDAIGDSVASLARQAADFKTKTKDFEDGLGKIKTAGTAAADAMKTLNEEIERNRMLQDLLTDKGLALEKQRNRELQEKKFISPRERIQRDLDAENKAERDKATRELETLDRKIGQAHFAEAKTRRELDEAQGQQIGDEGLARRKRDAEIVAKRAAESQAAFDKVNQEQQKKIQGLRDERAGMFDGSIAGGMAWEAQTRMRQLAGLPPRDYDGEIRALEEQLELQRKLNEEQQRAADQARRSAEGAERQTSEARAKIQAALQRLQALEAERKRLESERQAKAGFLGKALPIDEATRKSAADEATFQIDREKAEADAKFWFKVYQEADQMPPDQRSKFLDSFTPKPAKPQPRPYPSDRGTTTSPTELKQFDDRRDRGRDVASAEQTINESGEMMAEAVDRLTAAFTNALTKATQRAELAISRVNNSRLG